MSHKKIEDPKADKVSLAKEHESVRELWEKDALLMQKMYWSYEAVPLLHVKELDVLSAEEVSNVPYLQDVYKKLQRKSHKALKSPVYYEYTLAEIQKIPDIFLQSSNSARILLQVNDFIGQHPAQQVKQEGHAQEHYALVQKFSQFIQKNSLTPLNLRQLQNPEHRLHTQFRNIVNGIDCKVHWGLHEKLRQQYAPYLAHAKKTLEPSHGEESNKTVHTDSVLSVSEKLLKNRSSEVSQSDVGSKKPRR